jgi:hypothetical protein
MDVSNVSRWWGVLERAQEMMFVHYLLGFPKIEGEMDNDEYNGHIVSIWHMQIWYEDLSVWMKKVLWLWVSLLG